MRLAKSYVCNKWLNEIYCFQEPLEVRCQDEMSELIVTFKSAVRWCGEERAIVANAAASIDTRLQSILLSAP
jgi:hypothetical protein